MNKIPYYTKTSGPIRTDFTALQEWELKEIEEDVGCVIGLRELLFDINIRIPEDHRLPFLHFFAIKLAVTKIVILPKKSNPIWYSFSIPIPDDRLDDPSFEEECDVAIVRALREIYENAIEVVKVKSSQDV